MTTNEELLKTHPCAESENSVKENEIIFYAVYVPKEINQKSLGDVHVYTNQDKALLMMKQYQNGRFKSFKNYADAEQFALYGDENNFTSSVAHSGVILEERFTNCKALQPQQLVGFRKLVESGKVEEVKHIIWENPRYLVSSCDTPAILQEGCRYNALHVAVKSEQTEMCELILNTVANTKFLKLLYGEDECETYVDRAQMLLDRYLNTPDKGLNETPLHFAVKFGLKNIVKVLVSYSQCLKTLTNKYNQRPVDLICSRKHAENEILKKEIYNLLQEQYYVPVLRSIDNTLQPMIGDPFSPADPPCLNIDPKSPPIEVRAFAGPMTKDQAMEFKRKWKTPPRYSGARTPCRGEYQPRNLLNSMHNSVQNLSCRLQDTEKGLERVGRELAKECSVSWKEYWPFLNEFADLRCTEGLTKLEKYLKSRFQTMDRVYKKLQFIEEDEQLMKKDIVETPNNSFDEINKLCKSFKAASLSDDDTDDEERSETDDTYFTPLSSPIISSNNSSADDDDDMYTAEEWPTKFIEGDVSTKLDYAVFNAIPQIIDPQEFPYIYLWRHEMQLILKEDPHRFDNNTPVRRRLHPIDKSKHFNLKPLKIEFNV